MFGGMIRRLVLAVAASSLLLGPAGAAEKMSFWNTQRKGANCFNAEPREAWFAAARDLGVDWVRLAYAKWRGQRRDFLMGDADNFQGVVPQDLARLVHVLDWAQKYDIKVVIAPLGLPGNRWIQNNDNRRDLRLWSDKAYWQRAAAFWAELAAALKDHPAVCAYNLLNEPTPEMKTGLPEHGAVSRYEAWYEKYRGTAHDLPAFYETLIAAIRQVDGQTPIMLDAGWYALPRAFVYWPRVGGDKVLYACHMYEPYAFTNHRNFRREEPYIYPGRIPYAGREIDWNRRQIERHLAPFLEWAKAREIPVNRLVCGEFGCYRRNPGAAAYLADVVSVLNEHDLHWAFYSFREDAWDGHDYELGTTGLGAAYWQAKEAGKNPPLDRRDNPLFDVIKRQFSPHATAQRADAIEAPEVRKLVEALSSEEWLERERAARDLWTMGLKASAAVPFLIERLGDEEWRVRKAVAMALSRMGPAAKPAVPSLTRALADEEWHVRKPAAEALAALGRASEPAVPQLIDALNDEEWHVRKPAAEALAAIGPAAKPAVTALIFALNDEEWHVRRPAAEALGAIGSGAKDAVSALRKCLNDPEEQVQRAAADAIEKITRQTRN
ncbi:MAG: HEAT repeat domain-containing protein [Phycisphaerales bacterium]|nr:MAG: HEAT repeat domain-containing protein [Phycisphaerales bacterium]